MPFETRHDQCGFYETECCGCDTFARTDDLGLCEECASKLDRDLIRQRDWDYSASAFAAPPERREELRSAIIREYGKELELITSGVPGRPSTRARKGKGKRKRNGRIR